MSNTLLVVFIKNILKLTTKEYIIRIRIKLHLSHRTQFININEAFGYQ